MGKFFMNFIFYLLLGIAAISCKKDEVIDEPVVPPPGGNPGTGTEVVDNGDYFVSPNGNDNNPGTMEQPWATWQKAFSTAEAGDTVYFYGGTYKPTKAAYWNNITMIKPGDGIGNDGTYENPICFFNYPGQQPVLDCSEIRTSGNFNTGINMEDVHFIKFRGLTIRNIRQYTDNVSARAIVMVACSNISFESVSVHDIDGAGFNYFGCNGRYGIEFDTVRFINCDAYNLCDLLGESPGNMADGWKCDNEANAYFQFKGCRAWNCSDDGFDVSGNALTLFDHCWAFNIGNYKDGNGNGFKIGAIRDSVEYPTRIVTNCVAAFCHNPNTRSGSGFLEIDYASENYYRVNARIYNNTAYKNDIGFQALENPNRPFRNSVYINNIAYASTHLQDGVAYDVLIQNYPYPEQTNTWQWRNDSWPPYFIESETVDVTDNDFQNLDATQLKGQRKSDGSLPDITFLHLTDDSDLINAGTDVGIPYLGVAPDIGAFERK